MEGAVHQVPSSFLRGGDVTTQSQTLGIQDPGLFTWGARRAQHSDNMTLMHVNQL